LTFKEDENGMRLILLLVPIFTASFIVAQAETATLPAETVSRLDDIIETAMKENNLPSVAVGVWMPGIGDYVKAFGTANLETGRTREISDPFRIASISKTFTATSILQLVDEGKLSTRDTLDRWYPDFPNAAEITIKDLLMMRSGIPDFANETVMTAYYDKPLEPFSADNAVAVSATKTAEFSPPDEKTVYINTNFVLLEQIVTKVSAQDLDTFLAEHVFIPLGMAETFYATDSGLPSLLHGYSWDADAETFRDMTEVNPDLPGGAGAVVSTLRDLHIYMRALCTGELLEPETHRQRLSGITMDGAPNFIKYGEGILLFGQFCGHNGTIFGFNSEAFYLPAKDAVIVINVNRLDKDDQSQSAELFLSLTKELFPEEVNW
jgi:D-alanyl-D-alanine carboxypeptidase